MHKSSELIAFIEIKWFRNYILLPYFFVTGLSAQTDATSLLAPNLPLQNLVTLAAMSQQPQLAAQPTAAQLTNAAQSLCKYFLFTIFFLSSGHIAKQNHRFMFLVVLFNKIVCSNDCCLLSTIKIITKVKLFCLTCIKYK